MAGSRRETANHYHKTEGNEMRWWLVELIPAAFVLSVVAFALGLSVRTDTFAARWAPALTMQPMLEWKLESPPAPTPERSRLEGAA